MWKCSAASPDQALALAALPGRERIALALVGVLVGPKLDAHGRAFEVEALAKYVTEIAAIRVGHVRRLIAVDDDYRRVAAALVRITQFDAAALHERRLMLLDRLLEHARELGRRHLAHRGLVRRVHGAQQFAHAGAVQRRDE